MAVKTPTQEVVAQLAVYQRRVISGRRWQYVAFAALGSGAFWIVAALLYYFGVMPAGLVFFGLGLTLALPLLALLAEALRRPSLNKTATLIDRRLDDKQRLTTAMQLIEQAETGKLAAEHLANTAGLLARVDPRGVYPARRPWPMLALDAALIFFALGIFLLRGANGDFRPFSAGSLPRVVNNASAMPTITPPAGLPALEPIASASGPGNTGSVSALSPQDAAAQAQTSADAKQALDALGQALSGQSVAQGTADSLKQGDYAGAGQQLQQLAQQNDQLSDQAKKDLSQALNAAAANANTAPDLQQAEQNAANALNSGDYQAIVNALNNLANVMNKAGDKVITQQQLVQNYQPTPAPSGAQGQAQSGQINQQGSQSGQASPPGQQGQSSTTSSSGTRVSGPGAAVDPTVTGNLFNLGSNPGSGNTVPADSNDQGLTAQGSDIGSSSAAPPSTGAAVNSPADSNDTPINRWRIIEKYFSH